ncbi:MAG: hypothetical protein OH335_04060, partial [Candidatus Parvarchaeota archaeon]|nr:hypothetical protein [Candidatus Jingweiarchaeum tengchongense]
PKLKEYAMRASTILFYLLFIFIIFFFALYLITYFLDIKPIYSPINSFLFSTIKFISDFLQSFFK